MEAAGKNRSESCMPIIIRTRAGADVAVPRVSQFNDLRFENSEHETQTVGDILKEVKDFFRLNKAFKYLVLSLSIFFAITSVFYIGRAVRASHIRYFCGTVHLTGAVLHFFFKAGGKIHAEARASADILHHRGSLSVYTFGQPVRDDSRFCRH